MQEQALLSDFKPGELITAREAAVILTENAKKPVSEGYVRVLASRGKIHPVPVDARTNLYKRDEIKSYTVGKTRGFARKKP